MARRFAAVGFALLFALGMQVPSARAEATVSRDGLTVEDLEIGYRIRRPVAGWELLAAEDARALHPEAVVGGRDAHGTRAVLILHPGAVDALGPLGDAAVKSLALEEPRVIQDVEVILDGKRARRILVEGKVNGTSAAWRITLAARGGRVAEIRAWRKGTALMPAYVDLARFERAITFLPAFGAEATSRRVTRPATRPPTLAPAVRRAPAPPFKSGTFPVALAPPLGWRRAGDAERVAMNPDAEVALVHQATEAYLVVLAERVPAADRAVVEAGFRAATAARLGVVAEVAEQDMRAFGSPLAVDRYRVPEGEPPLTFWHGATGRDDVCIQVLAWGPTAVGKKGEEEIAAALTGLRWLREGEAAAARAEALRRRTERTRVGADWALRGLRYLDFAHDFGLRLDETTDWRLEAGLAADARVPGARLILDSPSRGCRVAIVSDPGLGLPGVVYHEAAARRIWGADSEAAAAEPLVETRAKIRTRTTSAGGPSEHVPPTWIHLTTMTHRGVAIQVVGTGLNVNREGVEAATEEVLAALSFPKRALKASYESEGALIDRQFGFRLDVKGGRGGVRDVTPDAWRGRGRVVTTALGEARLFLAAYASGEVAGEADSEALLAVLEAELKAALPATFVEGKGALAGRPARRLVLAGPTRRIHMLRAQRGDLTYVLAYAWDPRRTKPPVGQEKRFHLIR